MARDCAFSLVILLASCCPLKAQDADSLFLKTDHSILSYDDSLSIFQLIDSLLNAEDISLGSTLATRLSYNSNVLSAGRTLGIEQFGLSPGIAYYHKSGFYADVSAFWSKDFEPAYYLTILAAGYIHSFSNKFSVFAGYDRYFYNSEVDDAYIPFKNALTVSPYLDLKRFTFRSDYAYYFGEQTAHRLMPSISVNFEKKGFLKIDKILFAPAAYLLFGNETLTEIEIQLPETRFERLRNYYKYGTPYRVVAIEKVVFGLMNYAFSFPLTVSYKNWSFNFSYTYTIPRALDGEPLLISESSFLAGGVTYYTNFKKKKAVFPF